MQELRLGIIGLSEGNGHPYSWSAIFNGYNPDYMKDCPFPVIPEYLAKQKFPEDTIKGAKVTHIWTQNRAISEHVAKSSFIDNIVENYTDIIGQVDAILLARDDAELHLEMSKPFLEAGLPVYIDKPLAYDVKTAREIYSLEKYDGQIFSCSAIAYGREFHLTQNDFDKIGKLRHVDAQVMKSWKKYGVHIIEPVLRLIGDQGQITSVKSASVGDKKTVFVLWESGLQTNFTSLGRTSSPIKINLFGYNSSKELVFSDTFYAFKSALQEFIDVIHKQKTSPSKEFTLNIIRIIEEGNLYE